MRAWTSAKVFSRGQSRHFAYLFQIVGNTTQMDVHKKKMSNVTATVANSVFPVGKLYTEQMFVFSERGYFKTELAEF